MHVREFNFGATKLQLKKFNIHDMAEHCTIAMIAKRGTGKSYLTRELLFHKRHIGSAIAISRTEKLNSFYTEFIPESYIYPEYTSDILNRIFQRQDQLIEDNKERLKKNKKLKDDSLILIMDDCMSSKGTWLKDPNILELFYNGRHHHVSFILTMQYAVGIPPDMRSNFDYVFLLAEDTINNRKRLYEHYAGMFPTFDIFQQVFSEITNNYGVMVINKRVQSNNITDKIFWYKAKNVPHFKIGNTHFKKFHKEYFDEDWNKKIEVYNPFNNNYKHKIIVEKIKE
jgi:hypothetical protein